MIPESRKTHKKRLTELKRAMQRIRTAKNQAKKYMFLLDNFKRLNWIGNHKEQWERKLAYYIKKGG